MPVVNHTLSTPVYGRDASSVAESLLRDLRAFNSEHWVVRYPVLEDQPQTPEVCRPTSHHSFSVADDSSFRADVVVSPLRGGLVQSITLPNVLEKEEDDSADKTPEPSSFTSEPLDFGVFQLDLKLGTHSSSPATLVIQLKKSSISKLIDKRIGTPPLDSRRSAVFLPRVRHTLMRCLLRREINRSLETSLPGLPIRSLRRSVRSYLGSYKLCKYT